MAARILSEAETRALLGPADPIAARRAAFAALGRDAAPHFADDEVAIVANRLRVPLPT